MHKDSSDVAIFAGSSGISFAKKMCDYLKVNLGESEAIHFSDGNVFVRVKEPVRNRDVFVIMPIALDPNTELVELLFWLDAFKRASANSVTAVIPYFGYAKGDKKDEPRVSIRARVCADCIETAGADRVITMDLHSPQVQGFFSKPVDHLLSLPVLCESVKSMNFMKDGNLVVVSPDAGFAKDARKYADYLGVDVAIGDKTRRDHNEKAEILELIGNVEGKNCLIVDDFTISGGTLIDIARMLKQKGAQRIGACLGHVMVREKGVQKLEESPIEFILSTDSVDNPYVQTSDKFITASVAPLFAEAVKCIYNKESLSHIFDKLPDKIIDASKK